MRELIESIRSSGGQQVPAVGRRCSSGEHQYEVQPLQVGASTILGARRGFQFNPVPSTNDDHKLSTAPLESTRFAVFAGDRSHRKPGPRYLNGSSRIRHICVGIDSLEYRGPRISEPANQRPNEAIPIRRFSRFQEP